MQIFVRASSTRNSWSGFWRRAKKLRTFRHRRELKPGGLSHFPLLQVEAEEAFRTEFECSGNVQQIGRAGAQPSGQLLRKRAGELEMGLSQCADFENFCPEILLKVAQRGIRFLA